MTDLAEALGYSPARILEYVANEIDFEPYFGALKGADATLQTRSGSATDQASLLIALLRASNVPARYVRGTVQYENQELAEEDSPVNRWLKTRSYAASQQRLASGENPTSVLIVNASSTPVGLRFAHVWVEACVPYAHYRGARLDDEGHRWIPLDPRFESRRQSEGLDNLATFDFDEYLSGFQVKLPHEVFEDLVRESLSGPSESLKDVGLQSERTRLELDILPASLPYSVVDFDDWSNSGTPDTAQLPDSHRYFLHITTANGAGTDLGAGTIQRLSGALLDRLTLRFEGATPADQTALDAWRAGGGMLPAGLSLVPELLLGGSSLSTGTVSVPSESTDNQVTMAVTLEEARGSISDPCVTVPATEVVNAVCFDNIGAANYHALQTYAFQSAPTVLDDLARAVVDAVNATPQLSDALDETVGRFLHYAALKYVGDISRAGHRVGQLKGSTGDSGLHLGLTSTQSHVEKLLEIPFGISKQGFLIDVPGGQSRSRDLVTGESNFEGFVLTGYSASAFETFIWQETARLDAVSTVIGLQHANEAGTEVLTITTANQATELPKIKTTTNDPGNPLAYPPSFVTDILQAVYLDNGFEVKVPVEQIDFQGWEGYVLVATRQDMSGSTAAFPISGGFAGGFSVPDPIRITYNPATGTGYQGATTSTTSGTVGSTSQAVAQVSYGTVGNGSGPYDAFTGDPVNLVTGNFFHTELDISIPYRDLPIIFERAYNSRSPADGPLGFGWTHSFNHQLRFLDELPDGVEDGADTDGTTSSLAWIDGTGAERRVLVSGATAVGVPIGATMTPPLGFHFAVTREPDGRYQIVEKDGLGYVFENVPGDVDEVSRLTQIVSRNGNTLTLAYNGPELSTITDDTGRALTFTYTNGRITAIEDWATRRREYQYDGNGDLIEYRNPLALASLQPPVTYEYFTGADGLNISHAMKRFTLPRGNGQLIEYYVDGRVLRHTNTLGERFSFNFNDFRRETVTTDPRGGVRRIFFNEFGNPVEVIDEEGGVTRYEYGDALDPYNRTASIGPHGLRTEYGYDSAGNLTHITRPSGRTERFSAFDPFNQPGRVEDARGNFRIFKFSGAGNLTDEIILREGVDGDVIDPTSYDPSANPAQVLAWTRHEYDGVGNLTRTERVRDIANARGFEKVWTYDVNDLYPIQVERCGDKDGDGLVADDPCDMAPLILDTLGRLREGVNERFEPILREYDDLDRITRASDALGELRDFGYDANGNPNYEGLTIDAAGQSELVDSSSTAYDLSDRRVLEIDAGGFSTRFTYDPGGNLVSTTGPDGYTTHFRHDRRGTVVSALDEEGREIRTDVDVLGRPIAITDPNGNVRTLVYYGASEDGRLQQECDALDRCTRFDYDGTGKVTTLTDADGGTTLSTYDALGRPVRVVGPVYTDPTHGSVRPVTTYEYDALGNLLALRAGRTDTSGTNPAADVLAAQRVSTYDDWSRVLTETDALGRTWTYTPSVSGDIVRIEDPKGQILERDYGLGGVLDEQRAFAFAGDPNPHVITYEHNALGQAEQITAPEVTYQFSYDPAHRLARATDSRGGAWIEYSWSPGGLLDGFRDDQGRETDFLYDPTGRLTFILAPDGEAIGYRFDDGGRLVRRDAGGGVSTEYRYFADDSLDSQITTGPGGVLHSQSYTYDALGRRNSMSETLGGASRSQTYAYDALSRLLSVTEGANTESWTYDSLGNRVTYTPVTGPVEVYVHDAANQLLEIQEQGTETVTHQFLYDPNGNQRKQCIGSVVDLGTDCTGDDELVLTYDPLGRLVQAQRTGLPLESYAYDPMGRRIRKVVGSISRQLHYDGDTIYQEIETDWTAPTARFVHGPRSDSPVLRYAGGQTLAYQQDGLGSVVATNDAGTGSLVSTQGFDAWGNPAVALGTGPPVPTYGYTGREPDATGLIYYRARYYDPSVGRYTQRDPLGFADGVNLYAYVANTPTNANDPSGEILNFVVGAGANVILGGTIRGLTGGDIFDAKAIAFDLAVGAATSGLGTLAQARNVKRAVDALRTQGKVVGVAHKTKTFFHDTRSNLEAVKAINAGADRVFLNRAVGTANGLKATPRTPLATQPDVGILKNGRFSAIEVASKTDRVVALSARAQAGVNALPEANRGVAAVIGKTSIKLPTTINGVRTIGASNLPATFGLPQALVLDVGVQSVTQAALGNVSAPYSGGQPERATSGSASE